MVVGEDMVHSGGELLILTRVHNAFRFLSRGTEEDEYGVKQDEDGVVESRQSRTRKKISYLCSDQTKTTMEEVDDVKGDGDNKGRGRRRQ
ncbi:uncharacterized protein G2W53_032915 [Senna tora]|uniref:Uncharacterized protein n=1 Tax=Senna tora TaxID=362788 RepID=A0A834WCA8_9FABA|nr:uncharacterized protein G2W53_032915 [Senna tora]